MGKTTQQIPPRLPHVYVHLQRGGVGRVCEEGVSLSYIFQSRIMQFANFVQGAENVIRRAPGPQTQSTQPQVRSIAKPAARQCVVVVSSLLSSRACNGDGGCAHEAVSALTAPPYRFSTMFDSRASVYLRCGILSHDSGLLLRFTMTLSID